jgi:hypothetical protein
VLGEFAGRRLACGALLALIVAMLFAAPAQAQPSHQPAQPKPSTPGGLPIQLPALGGVHLPIKLPIGLGMLTGKSTTPPPTSTSPSRPPSSAPPSTNRPPTHTRRPSSTHPTAPASRGSAQPAKADRRFAVAAGVARTHAVNPHKHPRHRSKTHAIRPAAHRGAVADLFKHPLSEPNVELLLGVIALLGLGVIGIVTMSGRRARPARKHRR